MFGRQRLQDRGFDRHVEPAGQDCASTQPLPGVTDRRGPSHPAGRASVGSQEPADRLEKALDQTIAEGVDVTYDLKQRRDDPTAKSTSEVADALVRKLRG